MVHYLVAKLMPPLISRPSTTAVPQSIVIGERNSDNIPPKVALCLMLFHPSAGCNSICIVVSYALLQWFIRTSSSSS